MVGWSGTRSPRLEYSRKTWPTALSVLRLRNTSPQAQWKKLGIVPRILPCVPLPAPGAPNNKNVRYFIEFSNFGVLVLHFDLDNFRERDRGFSSATQQLHVHLVHGDAAAPLRN